MDYSKRQFEKLFKENYRMMYRVAYSITEDEEDAKDVVSQVFTEIWRNKPQITDGAQKGYLLSATKNQSLHALRKRKRQQEFEHQLTLNGQVQSDSEHRELMTELHRVIEENLTEQDCNVLYLHYEDEMSYAETAGVLGISVSAVNKHITHSLSKIRNILKTAKQHESRRNR